MYRLILPVVLVCILGVPVHASPVGTTPPRNVQVDVALTPVAGGKSGLAAPRGGRKIYKMPKHMHSICWLWDGCSASKHS